VPNVTVLKDGYAVSRSSDFIIYSVEAEFIDDVVAKYGPCVSLLYFSWLSSYICIATKQHAVVAGQTSVKDPERRAFERHLPLDVHIVSCHSLHGPGVSPVGQPLVRICLRTQILMTNACQALISHRASQAALKLVENILRPFQSRFVYLSYEEHDLVTANTQAVTHAAFLR